VHSHGAVSLPELLDLVERDFVPALVDISEPRRIAGAAHHAAADLPGRFSHEASAALTA
jgi:hypothetical protein